jgi:hypothetical protein
LGVEGCSLTDELILSLSSLVLNVNLSNTDPFLLLFLISLLLLGEELCAWLWCGGTQWDH